MIHIEKVKVYGFEQAIRGMRNPLNSWGKSDSKEVYDLGELEYIIGPNDMSLAMRLVKSGRDHRKFLRMITVYMDITAPLYWWKEFDTYKVGTVANSCSTMHTIHKKPFTLDDFSTEHLYPEKPNAFICKDPDTDILENDTRSPINLLTLMIDHLNVYRERYLETKDKDDWWQLIQLLPSSYNQIRTVMLNYEVIRNIYHSRKEHKLDEWRTFCRYFEDLPYSEFITEDRS